MQHCWPATANVVRCYMLRQFVAFRCMLLRVVESCCAKFETGQTFKPTTLSISFVPWLPKRIATMLDSFTQLFQHCWCHACALPMVSLEINHCVTILSLENFNVSILSHNALQVPTLLGVVAFVCTLLLTLSNNSHNFRANNAGSYCVRLLVA